MHDSLSVGSVVLLQRIVSLILTGKLCLCSYERDTIEHMIRANIGSYTFQEAYARTGRVLNIVVAPAEDSSKEMPRLLNYLTAPTVLIWTASLASCAIPGVFEPVELLCKDEDGTMKPYYNRGVKWSDGGADRHS